jgi:hypothetical protein
VPHLAFLGVPIRVVPSALQTTYKATSPPFTPSSSRNSTFGGACNHQFSEYDLASDQEPYESLPPSQRRTHHKHYAHVHAPGGCACQLKGAPGQPRDPTCCVGGGVPREPVVPSTERYTVLAPSVPTKSPQQLCANSPFSARSRTVIEEDGSVHLKTIVYYDSNHLNF